MLSQNGHLSVFKKGFELACKDVDTIIIPFYLKGLWGSKLSQATSAFKQKIKAEKDRRVSVTFGKALPPTTTAPELKQKVTELSINAWKQYTDNFKSIPEEWLTVAKKHFSDISLLITVIKCIKISNLLQGLFLSLN